MKVRLGSIELKLDASLRAAMVPEAAGFLSIKPDNVNHLEVGCISAYSPGVRTDLIRPNWRERWVARFKAVRRSLIQFDETGMMVTAWHADGSESKTELKWNEVQGVVVYKRDCYTVDLICMVFETPDGAVELSEEMDGWSALIDAVPRLLPGTTSKAEWWDKVAQLPLAVNPTTLFSS